MRQRASLPAAPAPCPPLQVACLQSGKHPRHALASPCPYRRHRRGVPCNRANRNAVPCGCARPPALTLALLKDIPPSSAPLCRRSPPPPVFYTLQEGRNLSMPSSGSCGRVRHGAICLRNTAGGAIRTAASSDGGMRASGNGCWKSASTNQTWNGSWWMPVTSKPTSTRQGPEGETKGSASQKGAKHQDTSGR